MQSYLIRKEQEKRGFVAHAFRDIGSKAAFLSFYDICRGEEEEEKMI